MSEKYLKYIGKEKGVIPGVPARDLTYKEAQDIGIVYLIQSGLYVYDYKEAIPEEYKADLLTTSAPVEAEETKEEPAPEEAKPTKRKRARKE